MRVWLSSTKELVGTVGRLPIYVFDGFVKEVII